MINGISPLLEDLRQTGIDAETLTEVLALLKNKGVGLTEALLQRKLIEEERLLMLLSRHFRIPLHNGSPLEGLTYDFHGDISLSYLKKHKVVPLRKANSNEILIAINDPTLLDVIDDMRRYLGAGVLILATQDVILAAISRLYNASQQTAREFAQEMNGDSPERIISEIEETTDLLDETSNAPVVKLVNLLLAGAIRDRASDIHIEPYQDFLKVRYRIDGLLSDVLTVPRRIHSPLTSRIKIMARLNIAEKRLPQDGRLDLKIAEKNVDVRVAIIPTAFGERVVLRLLDKSQTMLGLAELGMDGEEVEVFNRIIGSPYGIVLVTGPTGSGKTTTLYAALTSINSPGINIITIEDPIEYQIEGVSQIQVNPKIDLTFAKGLRSLVRQDPDVILVGEIRDQETAEIAIQSSLTGHLVFSTLHTNDAAGAVTRLIDMEVEPYLVTSSLIAVVAQRLVRLLCPHCKEPYTPNGEVLANIGLSRPDIKDRRLYRKTGCAYCMHRGYRGRTAIFEIMLIDEEMKRLILKSSDATQIARLASKRGMRTLLQAGARKVLMGLTTPEEVLRVTRIAIQRGEQGKVEDSPQDMADL